MVKAIQDDAGKNNGYFCFHSRLQNYKLQITLRLVVMFCKGGERGVRLWIERIMIGNSNKLLFLCFDKSTNKP